MSLYYYSAQKNNYGEQLRQFRHSRAQGRSRIAEFSSELLSRSVAQNRARMRSQAEDRVREQSLESELRSKKVMKGLLRQVRKISEANSVFKDELRNISNEVNKFSFAHQLNSLNFLQMSALGYPRGRRVSDIGRYPHPPVLPPIGIEEFRPGDSRIKNRRKRSPVVTLRNAVLAIRMALALEQFYRQKVAYRKFQTSKLFETKGVSVAEGLLRRLIVQLAQPLKYYADLVKSSDLQNERVKFFLDQLMSYVTTFKLEPAEVDFFSLFSCNHSVMVTDLLTEYEYRRLDFNAKEPFLRQVSFKQTKMLFQFFFYIRLLLRYVLIRPWTINPSIDKNDEKVQHNCTLISSVVYGLVISQYMSMPVFERPTTYAIDHNLKIKSYIPYKKDTVEPKKGCLIVGIDTSHPKRFSSEQRAWWQSCTKKMEIWAQRIIPVIQQSSKKRLLHIGTEIKKGRLDIFEEKYYR